MVAGKLSPAPERQAGRQRPGQVGSGIARSMERAALQPDIAPASVLCWVSMGHLIRHPRTLGDPTFGGSGLRRALCQPLFCAEGELS